MAIYRIPDAGSVGIVRDVYPHELPDGAWSDGQNVRFMDGMARKIGGFSGALIGGTSVVPYGVFYAPALTTKYTVYCGLAKIYKVAGSTHTEVTGTAPTGAADDKWVGTNLSGLLVLTNGKDAVQYLNPSSGNAALLTNWTSNHKCKSIRAFKNHLVAMNVTKDTTRYPYMVKWSHPADPGAVPSSWDETDTTKDAGEVDLGDSYGQIFDGAAFGDVMLVWKANATYAMRYVGPPQIFAFDKVSEQSGIWAANCWCETPLGIVVLSSHDVVLHSGSEAPRSIIDKSNKRWLLDNIKESYAERAFLLHHAKFSEVLICFADANSSGWCNKALVWNYQSNTWGVRELPECTSGASILWDGSATADAIPTPVVASYSAQSIYSLDISEADATGTQASRLERTGLSFGKPDRVKLLRALRPRIDGTATRTVSVYVSGTMDYDAAASWVGPYTFTIGNSLKIDCLVSGRYFGVKIEATSGGATENPWRLRSIDFDVDEVSDY